MKKSNSSLQIQILILTFNNKENFKSIFEEYNKRLTEEDYSILYGGYYKPSFNIIVELIFENIKRKKRKAILKSWKNQEMNLMIILWKWMEFALN